MTSEECQNGMYKQITCQYGGETSYGNWKYRYEAALSDALCLYSDEFKGRIPTVAAAPARA